GEGTAQDPGQAFAWLARSSEQGEPEAQYRLGLLYLKGRGVARDDAQARAWFARAAAGGNAEAVARYHQFAEDGDIEAQYNLALMYLRGDGVGRDRRGLAGWMQRAASRGHLDAMFGFGLLHE